MCSCKCDGKEYHTHRKLTCSFHKLAYKIEIEYRAGMAGSLIHPELKRGHSNLMEVSHNVLIRFRSKHLSLERLHYCLSTDLGLLQANLTYKRNREGSDYHWIPELYRRMKLPLFGGIEEALKQYIEKRDKKYEKIKEEKHKKRRLQLKVKRVQEQEERKKWSRQHGGDTYGDSDDDTKAYSSASTAQQHTVGRSPGAAHSKKKKL